MQQRIMQVMDPTGHTKVEWDADIPAEVANAKATYKSMTDNGYYAYRINAEGEPATRLTEFDPEAEKMILRPQLRGG